MPNQPFAISDVQDSAGLVFDIFHSPRHRMRLRKNAPAREATEARVSPFLKGQAHSSMASRRAQLPLRLTSDCTTATTATRALAGLARSSDL